MRTERQRLALSTLSVSAGFVVLFCYLTYISGQHANWDFYNYHYYNAYAFLNDRFWYDIQPAQRQSYFSPFLDVPFYWLTQKWGILKASLVYAAFQSLQAPALFFLAYSILRQSGTSQASSTWVALILTSVAILAPLNFQQIGTSQGDSTTATFIVGGFALFMLGLNESLRPASAKSPLWLITGAGILMGLAVGLKLTNGPYLVALLICIVLLQAPGKVRLLYLLMFSLASLLALLVSYGYWGWFLYEQFQNPVFPQFNHIFQSDYIKAVPFTDERYTATGLLELIFYPFYFNILSGKISGQQFLDLRIPIAYLMIVASISLAIIYRLRHKQFSWHQPQASMLIFYVSAYVIWLILFSLTRYALTLEVLAPLAILAAVTLWASHGWLARIAGVAAILPIALYAVALPMSSKSSGPRVAWTDSPFDVQFPYNDLENSMVIVHGGEAMSFVVPSAPASTRFIRVNSNLYYVGFRSLEERFDNAMGDKIYLAIAAHKGAFFALLTDKYHADVDAELALFNLRRIDDSCRPLTSKGGPRLNLCRAQRTVAAIHEASR